MRYASLLVLLSCGRFHSPGSEDVPRELLDTGEGEKPADSGIGEEGGGGGEPEVEVIGGVVEEGLCQVELTCGAAIPEEPALPCAITVTDASGGAVHAGLAGVDKRGRSSLSFPKPQYAVELWSQAQDLVPAGATWRYWDGAEAPPSGWEAPGFDDGAWASGAAPLGYGDEGLATALQHGDDPKAKPLVAWFRLTFDPPDWPADLSLLVRRDDGAAVYLNGEEVWRDNLPEGELGADTPALGAADGDAEAAFTGISLDPRLLVEGENTLAVRVHQHSPASSDLAFDLRLLAGGGDVAADLLGMGGESDWILSGNYVDRSLFRNRLSYDLFRGMGRYAPQLAFCELTVDGEWMGIYTLGERIERDDDRLDIAAADGAGGSFIVKSDDRDEPVAANTVGYGDWVLVYPNPEDATYAQEQAIAAWLESWQGAVRRWDPDDNAGIFTWLDRGSAIDFLLLQELARNSDAYTLSVHLWRDEGAPMQFAPWDIDLSYGYPADDCGATGWVRRQDFVAAMVDMPGFKEDLAARWRELRQGPLADVEVLTRIQGYREVLGDRAYANFERWPMDAITFDWGEGNQLCPVASYDEEYERFQGWVVERMAWMDANIDAF